MLPKNCFKIEDSLRRQKNAQHSLSRRERGSSFTRSKNMYFHVPVHLEGARRSIFDFQRRSKFRCHIFALSFFQLPHIPSPRVCLCCMSHIFPTLSLAAIYDKSYPQQRIYRKVQYRFQRETMMLRAYSAVCVLRYPPEGDIAQEWVKDL